MPRTKHGQEESEAQGEVLFTPDDIASRMKVRPEQVRSLIRQGLLRAVNISTGKKRPLYRIPKVAYDEFIEERLRPRPALPQKKFNRLPSAPDFFPNLK